MSSLFAQRPPSSPLIITPTSGQVFEALNGVDSFSAGQLATHDFSTLFREMVDVGRPFLSRFQAARGIRSSERTKSDLDLLFRTVEESTCENLTEPRDLQPGAKERWWTGQLAAIAMQGEASKSPFLVAEANRWMADGKHQHSLDRFDKAVRWLGNPQTTEAIELLGQAALAGYTSDLRSTAVEQLIGVAHPRAADVFTQLFMTPPRTPDGGMVTIRAAQLLGLYRPESARLKAVISTMLEQSESETARLNLSGCDAKDARSAAIITEWYKRALEPKCAPGQEEMIRNWILGEYVIKESEHLLLPNEHADVVARVRFRLPGIVRTISVPAV